QESGEEIAQIGVRYPEYRALAYSLAGLLMLNGDDQEGVTQLLELAFASGVDPASHPFVKKYLYTEIQIHVATGVTAHLPISRDAVGLALAEVYQHAGELEKAIDVVEQLNPTSYAAVSLADLYSEARRFDDVLHLTDGITNQDEATTVLLIL